MKAFCLAGLVAVIATDVAPAATVLVGAGVRNGDFNDDTSDVDQRSFGETPFWENIAGVQTAVAARLNLNLNDGAEARNAQLNRATSQVFGQSTGHTIALGDVFSVSYWWRDAFQWNDAADVVRINLFTTDNDTIGGTRSVIATTDSALSTVDSTYEEVDTDGFYTAVGGDVDKILFVSIDTAGDASGFARLDDFELIVDPVPEPSTGFLAGLGLLLAFRRRR